MVRRILGIFVVLSLSFGQILATAPTALADTSGTCIMDTLGCVTLVVNLSPQPATNATVHAKREGKGMGTDDSFDLRAISPGQYTSGAAIWGTASSGPPCESIPFGDNAYFDITVSGSASGGVTRVNMCFNETPKANLKTGIKTVPVPVTLAAAGSGGIGGHIQVRTIGSKLVDCPAGSNVTLVGPSGGKYVVGGGGRFDTGLVLKPGSYDVEINCILDGYPGFGQYRGVAVVDGKTTPFDKIIDQGTTPSGPPIKADPGVNVPATCDAGPHFTWLICDSIRVAMQVIDWIRDNIIVPFLVEKPLDKSDKNVAPVYAIWSQLRNVASIFFILIFFLVIFGTAIGWDNYNMKKILPRLVAGTILVPLSWYICVLVVDLGNVLGQGILSLMTSLVPTPNLDFTSSFSKLLLGGVLIGATVAATTALATIGVGVVVSLGLAFLGVFFTLVLRKILIILLICISPFALLAWILPNTNKWFEEWWSNFFKLVMMYPVIMLLFEAGRLFAATAGATAGNSAEKGVTPLFQLVGIMLPLFAVPLAFKWAGAGLELGRKGIGKATGAIDKRYGKDSQNAKERADQRKKNSARRAMDVTNNRIGGKRFGFDSKTLGAVKRGINMKRSGLGGFAGNSNIPLLRNNAGQKAKVNSASSAAENEEAMSDAQDMMRRNQPENAHDRIHNKTQAEFDKLVEGRISQSMMAGKNVHGISIKDLDVVTPADEKSEARVEEARASGDHVRLVEALKLSSSGTDNLEGMILEETAKGSSGADHALVGAALRKLSTSSGGTNRAQQLAMGTIAKYRGGDGKIHFAGGNGTNAVVATDEHGNQSVKITGKAAFGGDYGHNVADNWRDTWSRGMKNASSADTKKTMRQAAKDISPSDLAGQTVHEVERKLAYYDQGRDDPRAEHYKDAVKGGNDFAIAAAGIADSAVLTNGTSADTKAAIAEAVELRGPVVSAETADYFRSKIAAQAPEPSVTPSVASNIISATGNDATHASQIYEQIRAERATSPDQKSAVEEALKAQILAKGKLESADLAAAGAAAKQAVAAGEFAADDALNRKMAEQFSDNLDYLHEVERRYAQDDNYRKDVHDAFLRGKKLPSPPAGRL